MGFFRDMISVFTKKELSFIESRQEAEGVYTFLFEKDRDLVWMAGQYGLFTIAHRNVKPATKPFSIASAPGENVVRITTRIGDNPSDYKKALLELQKGMTIKMGGPVGKFVLQGDSPSLLIAGGIGITPFRAILKQIEAEGRRGGQQISLLYMDSDKVYIGKDELDEMASRAAITITYLDSRDDLHQEIGKFADLHKNDGQYFIAGPKSMVDSVAAHLQSRQIPKPNIKKDAFWGY